MAANGGIAPAALLVVVFVILAITVERGDAVLCHLCDSFEGNCMGSSCFGRACLKRVAFVDGMLRVSKMCQLSGADDVVDHCSKVPLWQGRFGTECLCQTDWCNVAPSRTLEITFALLVVVISVLFVV